MNYSRPGCPNPGYHRRFLGLGSHESVAFFAHVEAFEPVMKAEKIFRKRSQCG